MVLNRPQATALAVVILLLFATPAGAATVSVDGSTLRVVAAPGESNQLSIGADPGATSFYLTDAGATLTAGPGCTPADIGVTCVTPAEVTIDVQAGDLDDSVAVFGQAPALLDGGEGDDRLTGGDAGDTLLAGDGADFADGGDGDDVVEVRDRLGDEVWCGEGRDSVRGEVLDFLDSACERVDYGPAGSVGPSAPRTGGGRFVRIPGQTWARVDRRLLPDVLYLVRRYHVRVGAGYEVKGHERLGEHPLGLAVDLYPGPGGRWKDVSRLARWAEPRQNRPRFPFRWVGWNGDYNHGHPRVCKPRRGCAPHLHLSWSHSPGKPRRPVRTVWVFRVAVRAASRP